MFVPRPPCCRQCWWTVSLSTVLVQNNGLLKSYCLSCMNRMDEYQLCACRMNVDTKHWKLILKSWNKNWGLVYYFNLFVILTYWTVCVHSSQGKVSICSVHAISINSLSQGIWKSSMTVMLPHGYLMSITNNDLMIWQRSAVANKYKQDSQQNSSTTYKASTKPSSLRFCCPWIDQKFGLRWYV